MDFFKFYNALRHYKEYSKLEFQKYKKKQAINEFNNKTGNFINTTDIDLNSVKGSNIKIFEDSSIDSHTTIGMYTFIGRFTRVTKTSIGNYCSIANYVNIGDGEHPLETISTNSIFFNDNYDELTRRPCKIGNDVWIGVGSVIRRGVTIGDGAVIGANSFVNKDVSPFSIVAGSPAKVIRKRFTDDKIARIIKSNWWNFPLEEAKLKIEELRKQFQDIVVTTSNADLIQSL